MATRDEDYLLSRILDLAQAVMEHGQELTDESEISNFSALPFIEALGYNTRNPLHVRANANGEPGTGQSLETTYVLLNKDQKPALVVLVKAQGESTHRPRSLSVLKLLERESAQFAFHTDGVNYALYSRVVSPHHARNEPIAVLQLDSVDELLVRQLYALTRRGYDIEKMCDVSRELSFLSEVQANVEGLPRWALVAVLARIGRRALPIHYLIVSDNLTGAKEGVAWLWMMAAEGTALFDYRELERRVGDATRSGFRGDWMAGHMLANGAKLVAESIGSALRASYSDKFAIDAIQAIKKARTSVSQAVTVTNFRGSSSSCEVDENAKAMFDDAIVDELRAMVSWCQNEGCGNTTPVDPAILEELWSSEAPDTWPPDPWQGAMRVSPSPEELAASRSSYESCFISYSRKDKEFATRLHKSLSDAGIRCWLDEKEIRPGDEIHEEIDKAIRRYDRVILCCSRTSLMESWWVDRELDRAFEKERQVLRATGERFRALIPIDLDGFIFSKECIFSKTRDILSRHVADFSAWRETERFGDGINQIIRALEPRTADTPRP